MSLIKEAATAGFSLVSATFRSKPPPIAISAIGVAVATMALVIVLSVFNGFHDLVASLFTNFDPQLKVVPVEGKINEIEADCFIVSIGTSPNPLIKNTTDGLDANNRGCLVADENGATSREGVFAGGDAVTGAATVILAMGAGKKAAAAMDEYIQSK